MASTTTTLTATDLYLCRCWRGTGNHPATIDDVSTSIFPVTMGKMADMTYFEANGYLQTGKIPFVVLSYNWRRHVGGALCIFHQSTANSQLRRPMGSPADSCCPGSRSKLGRRIFKLSTEAGRDALARCTSAQQSSSLLLQSQYPRKRM